MNQETSNVEGAPAVAVQRVVSWHLEYHKRRHCDGFMAWFYHEWNFTNRFGIRDKGIRIMGITLTNFREGVPANVGAEARDL